MANKSNSRRWILLAFVALGVVLAATLPRRDTNDAEQDAEPAAAAGSKTSQQAAPQDVDGGLASRRIAENCDPIRESLKYEEFIGRRALAILSWDNMSERAANLRIPVYVVGIEDGVVGVKVSDIPMREQYLGVWIMSGHLQGGPEDTYLLDPCSAKIIAWEAMDRLHPPEDDDDPEVDEQ